MLKGVFKSLQAPTKLVNKSERICLTGTARKRLSALMKLDVSRDSMTSIWTALTLIHVQITAHLLLCERPPLVWREETLLGPNTSNPTFENICLLKEDLMEGSPFFGMLSGALSRLQVTHWWMMLLTFLFPPTIQKPTERTAPSVKRQPWWWSCSWCCLMSKAAMWCLSVIIKGIFLLWSRL